MGWLPEGWLLSFRWNRRIKLVYADITTRLLGMHDIFGVL
jgi:hypothetical protein